jgi:type IV secretory pathway VirB6-like protein
MNNRKVHYIDVSKMTEKELCAVLNIPYVPFYKSSFFWGMFILLSLPALSILL